jgi:arylsulfatase
VREGQWKLVALEGKPWRLFDLNADRTEQHDLAEAQPDRVKALASAWDAYAARANVLPLGGWRAPTTKKETFSKETRFTLKKGDHLDREQAPALPGRPFTITAKFDASTPDGVIVAQGGTKHGFSLYLDGGKLTFLTRVGGTAAMVSVDQVSAGAHTAVAQLAKSGGLTLTLDGKASITSTDAGRMFSAMPVDGLDVGADEGGLVGAYTGSNRFKGDIESVVITIQDP